MTTKHVIYECGICGCYHPWDFGDDCRDDRNRYGDPEEYAVAHEITEYDVEVRSMTERVEADGRQSRLV